MLQVNSYYYDKINKYPLVKNYLYTGNTSDLGALRHKDRIGVKIYQSNIDTKIGYRLYQNKNFSLSSYNHIEDAILIQKLQEYGKDILLTEFPKGVITYQNCIVGQVVPYYENSFTLSSILKNSNYHFINPYTLLIKAYQIIRELIDHGIIYYDIHGSNFLVSKEEIKLIDFEYDEIYFIGEGNYSFIISNMLHWFMAMANNIKDSFKPKDILCNWFKVDSFASLYEELKLGESLVKKL